MLRALLLLGVWVLLAIPVGLVALPWTVLTRDASLLYRWGVWIATSGLAAAGVRYRVRFDVPLPDTACIFLSNHASNLDPPLLVSVLRPHRTAMLIKQELLKIPLLGWGMRLAGFVAVARSGSVEDAKRSLMLASQVIRSGISMTVFAEGTRSPDGRLLPFKKGPFFLAKECGAPVVPVTLIGTAALLPKGKFRLRSGTVDVVVHAALDPRDFADRDALKDAVRAAIASALPATAR
ncbi:lysophospholipid acyltransferase family protein [Acidipila sp. EB88]|uniref:lysophospholipid acyltransferase family protein n=1 Tax=Acidipila sp. EB88 TaxID=2305226 RepID=UPI000F5EAD43|nr:lysophospholipid acyltransferase family protein [Acidipila sp. EB88]RRA47473.1 1-acyl-sn-glycerol-3-phosphate acyltransferase [Acidipila sp. EB88]